ncbi:type I restriction-modification system subunit M N-terminal domain-containing protein [Pseudogemmobacter sp. W21_MBD1_M6]|uniref:type I restriction-modification system subunit M N-terminal domain-containing protein n=1 Tax=Pseudogemmobacter sp. W21_MBD1_M6 TaxID=3240271 RepID=UPI003F9724F1
MASTENGSDLDIEASLFKTADKLRGNMKPSDYKHVALGLIFLKHISVGFELKRQALLAEYPEDAQDPDAYLADNVFWVSLVVGPDSFRAIFEANVAPLFARILAQTRDLLLPRLMLGELRVAKAPQIAQEVA